MSGLSCCDPTHVCADDGTGVFCFAPCTLADCDYGPDAGGCVNVAPLSISFCQPVEGGPALSDCTASDSGCEDEFGNSTDTICMPTGSGNHCMPTCEPSPSGCNETTHFCNPLVTGAGGVCLPLS
jgi:hypothetical protein